ncbi:hypothetical protein D9R08_10430 [Rhodophyticola porphyridii]|uniref:Uncharacterized protein n=1 Tax=Rhodophyticola porphyridii TaxID=1852017 RepID=A0A3L9XZD0_9RHOB|nr:hypothetical protein D9R08_10430 [Rhodophyticola porphyridii]
MGLAGKLCHAQQLRGRERTRLLEVPVLIFIDLGERDRVIGSVVALVLPNGGLEATVAQRLQRLI